MAAARAAAPALTRPAGQPAGARRRGQPGRTGLVVVGVAAVLAGLAAGFGGTVAIFAHAAGRDAAGFFTTSTVRLRTPTHALTSTRLDLGVEPGERGWAPGRETSMTARLRAGRADGGPVFVGIAPADAVDAFLARASHDEVVDIDFSPFGVEYRTSPGSEQPAPPASAGFWAAAAAGRGTRTVTWPVEDGRWEMVVMNADGSAGVAADVSAGMRTGVLLDVGLVLIAASLLALATGATLLYAARGPRLPDPGRRGGAGALSPAPPAGASRVKG